MLRKLLGGAVPSNAPPEITRTEVGRTFIDDTLARKCPNWQTGVRRIPLDGVYWTVSRDDMHAIVDHDPVDEREYKLHEFDCENFAMTLKMAVARAYGVNTLGVVVDWTAEHAYNVALYDDGEMEFLEPQTDVFLPPEMLPTGMHKLDDGIILL